MVNRTRKIHIRPSGQDTASAHAIYFGPNIEGKSARNNQGFNGLRARSK